MTVSTKLPFLGARLKMERANQHIKDADRTIKRFIDLKPYKVVVEKQPDGSRELQVVLTEPLCQHLPTIIGDAFHNLASALDHLTWEMVGLDHGKLYEHLQFPRSAKPSEYVNTLKGKIIGVRDETLRLFIEVEVYPGGKGDGIHRLIQADIVDKHCVVLAGAMGALVKGIKGTRPDGTEFIGGHGLNIWKKFDTEGRCHLVGLNDPSLKFELKKKPEVSLEIVFEDANLFGLTNSVVKTLQDLSQATSGIVGCFTEYVTTRGP